EVIERVLLDLAGEPAQRVGVGEIPRERLEPLVVVRLAAEADGVAAPLALPGGERVDRLLAHARASALPRSASRRTCARCSVRSGRPAFSARPATCMRQLESADTRTSGAAAVTCSSLSVPMAREICGKATENVPPKPQHCSASPISTTST